jgi:hypothetical protein
MPKTQPPVVGAMFSPQRKLYVPKTGREDCRLASVTARQAGVMAKTRPIQKGRSESPRLGRDETYIERGAVSFG